MCRSGRKGDQDVFANYPCLQDFGKKVYLFNLSRPAFFQERYAGPECTPTTCNAKDDDLLGSAAIVEHDMDTNQELRGRKI